MRKGLLVSAALAALSALAATTALAQDASATATSGSVRASAGFTPDPISVSIVSGGNIDASRLGGSCTGMIARAPDYEFTYTAGSYPLTFAVASGGDTTLVINGPDGRWYCDDDSSGLDPIVSFSSPRSGTYDIWIGAVGGQGASSTLMITEQH